MRARIVCEYPHRSYRTADLVKLPELITSDLDLAALRDRMTSILKADFAIFLPGAQQFMQLLGGPLPTSDIADLIAFHLLDDVPFKLSLLAECDVIKRVTKIVDALCEIHPAAGKAWSNYPNDPTCN